MKTIERRNCAAAEVRIEGDGEDRKIVGYAAVYYRADDPGTEYTLWGDNVERIMPGAFDRAISEDDTVGLFNHDSNMVLGRRTAGTMRLTVDDRGLRYEIDPPDTQTGRDVVASLERGDVNGSSFGFKIDHEEWVSEGDGVSNVRLIRGVKLFDVGPVTFPAYTSTAAGMRADTETLDEARASLEAWQNGRAAEQAEVRARRMKMKDVDAAAVSG